MREREQLITDLDAASQALTVAKAALEELAAYGPRIREYLLKGGYHQNTGTIEAIAEAADFALAEIARLTGQQEVEGS